MLLIHIYFLGRGNFAVIGTLHSMPCAPCKGLLSTRNLPHFRKPAHRCYPIDFTPCVSPLVAVPPLASVTLAAGSAAGSPTRTAAARSRSPRSPRSCCRCARSCRGGSCRASSVEASRLRHRPDHRRPRGPLLERQGSEVKVYMFQKKIKIMWKNMACI